MDIFAAKDRIWDHPIWAFSCSETQFRTVLQCTSSVAPDFGCVRRAHCAASVHSSAVPPTVLVGTVLYLPQPAAVRCGSPQWA